MVCDPDDWTYISSIRVPFPIWKNWNPSKVFPENLMGFCGFFSAYVVYPITNDYILSFTYVYAFVVSVFIVSYIIALMLLVKKILKITLQASIVYSFIAYLLHFLFMLSQDTNNMFMFTASNLNCFVNYTIPSLFCFVLATYFISIYLSDYNYLFIDLKREKEQQNYLKMGIIALLIYLAIFSNMVCNIIFVAPFIYMFLEMLFVYIRTNGVKRLFKISTVKKYGLFAYIFFLESFCLIFEYNGGRAESLSFNGGGCWYNNRCQVHFGTYQ